METQTQFDAPVGMSFPELRILQWNTNGEARLSDADRQALSNAVEDWNPAAPYRMLFPVHGQFGALALGIDGFSVFLYADSASFIVGELVHPSAARPANVPASGTVDISGLGAAEQEAIMTLLRAKSAKRR